MTFKEIAAFSFTTRADTFQEGTEVMGSHDVRPKKSPRCPHRSEHKPLSGHIHRGEPLQPEPKPRHVPASPPYPAALDRDSRA